MKADVDLEKLLERKADSRGRITLGSEYKNKQVKLLVIE